MKDSGANFFLGAILVGLTGGAAPLISGGVGSFLGAAGINMLLAGASQVVNGRQRDRNAPQRQGVKINVAGEDQPLYKVFGQVRVGGQLAIIGTSGTRNKYLHIAVCHAATSGGGLTDITDIWFNERKIDDTDINGSGEVTSGTFTDIALFERFLGTDSQAVDSVTGITGLAYVNAATAFGRGVARTHVRLERVSDDEAFQDAFPGGMPQVSALCEGRCYDPRLDSTNGGSGTHRTNNPDTWTFSDNPALCIATYMIEEELDGGCAVDPDDIDWTTVAAAANVCDTSVSVPDGLGGSTTQSAFTCNIVLDTADDLIENIEKMLTSMDGVLVQGLDGKYRLYAGEYDTPTTTIDEDWLREGNITVQNDPDTIYNAVRSTFTEPGANYETVASEPFTNATYESEDGRRYYKDLEYPATQNRYEAQYLNQIHGRKSRHQKTLVLPLNYNGLDIEIWENVTVSLDEPSVSGVFKVISWKWESAGPVVTLLEQNSDTWDVQLSDFTEINPDTLPALTDETPPTPTGLSATATADGIDLSWDPLGSTEYSEILIYRATSSGGSYSKIGEVRGTKFRDAITDGATYWYKIRARSALAKGVFSSYSSEVSSTGKVVSDGATASAVNLMPAGVGQSYTTTGNGWIKLYYIRKSLDALGLDAGDVISIDMAFKQISGTKQGRVVVRFFDSSGAQLQEDTSDWVGPGSFTREAIEGITIPASAVSVTVGADADGNSGEILVRRVMMNTGSVVAPYSAPGVHADTGSQNIATGDAGAELDSVSTSGGGDSASWSTGAIKKFPGVSLR